MNHTRSFIFATVLFLVFSLSLAPDAIPQSEKTQPRHLVHFVLINMAGKSREARVRNTIVTLPVAQPVTLQVLPGVCVKITSSSDRYFVRIKTISTADEGRVIPVD